jgi:phosphoglycerate kinase
MTLNNPSKTPTIQDLDPQGKRIFVRIDADVPLKNGEIVDDTRLRRVIPTLKTLLQQGAKQLILAGHIGRPQGKDPSLSTKAIAIRLNTLLGKTVQHINDCIDVELPNTPVVMIENLRYYKEEEANDPEFARKLASHADYYVNDAFATSHRAHASMVGVPQHIPGCVGLVVEQELTQLDFSQPEHPFIAIVAGAKLETKLPIIQHILPNVDNVLVGGAMMFTFYQAQGWETGTSLVDKNYVLNAQMLLNNKKLILPTDVVIAPSPEEGNQSRVVIDKGMPATHMGLDIGPASVEHFRAILSQAKTIVWNGPLGMVEKEPFNKATEEIAQHIATLTEQGVRTVVGGGDSIKIIEALGLADKYSHVSTGGGASMKLLEGKQLVAIEALTKKQ